MNLAQLHQFVREARLHNPTCAGIALAPQDFAVALQLHNQQNALALGTPVAPGSGSSGYRSQFAWGGVQVYSHAKVPKGQYRIMPRPRNDDGQVTLQPPPGRVGIIPLDSLMPLARSGLVSAATVAAAAGVAPAPASEPARAAPKLLLLRRNRGLEI